jgi:hypothetical protein
MRLTVQASCDWQNLNDRRQKVESIRQNKVARLRSDVDRITKREVEYIKEVVNVLVPIKLVWDADAWNRVKDFIPIRVELNKEQEPPIVVDPIVVDNTEGGN